jgi:hypothetical protein
MSRAERIKCILGSRRFLAPALVFLSAVGSIASGCGSVEKGGGTGLPATLKDVPAVRLNFRYEADVPAPPEDPKKKENDRNAGVQADFDQSRTASQDILDRTLASPSGERVLAVYHRAGDLPSEFRLDIYTAEGKLLRRITPDTMAVHFPDTIVWSPDSKTVAFVGMLRGAQTADADAAPTVPAVPNTAVPTPAQANTNSNAAANAAEDQTPEATPPPATPQPPAPVLTFRTEQIYTCDADGSGLKPVTQNEGLIYFYYVWSPDSSMLAALASTAREWQYVQFRADTNGEIFVPLGRPRVVEKNGRERRLDDAMTRVQPVWSPDSGKVAVAYDTQVRIYDAGGTAPTQAAIPLKNALLLSSQAFDQQQQQKLTSDNSNSGGETPAPSAANSAAQGSTLPDENTLVSFNPIIALAWPGDAELYFQTAFVKRMKNEADSVMSFPRWHRLIFSPQAGV